MDKTANLFAGLFHLRMIEMAKHEINEKIAWKYTAPEEKLVLRGKRKRDFDE